jgi:hypothetical protein
MRAILDSVDADLRSVGTIAVSFFHIVADLFANNFAGTTVTFHPNVDFVSTDAVQVVGEGEPKLLGQNTASAVAKAARLRTRVTPIFPKLPSKGPVY